MKNHGRISYRREIGFAALTLLLAGGALSCGEESTQTQNAVEQCESLYQAYCDRAQACELIRDAGGCFMQTQEDEPCVGEREADDDAEDCRTALADYSCEQLPVDLPATCLTTILGVSHPTRSPEEQCFVFVETYCVSLKQCGAYLTEEECRTEALTTLHCTEATGVKMGYDSCLEAIGELTCETVETLPGLCDGVIVFPDEDAR